ncbi:hypothetical protein ACJMK2_028119, partial [Sinanodonta woodiana]
MAYTSSSEENGYRLLLDKIAEELTHGDVDDLVFLLRFLIEGKRNRLSINGDPRKLLTRLQKQDYIGLHNLALLLELFDLIGRNDLIQDIKRYDCNITSENCQISPFIRDLWKFGQKIDESEDLKKSAFLLGWDKEIEEIQKPWQFFEKAFEKGILEKDEYNKLKEFANTIGQTKTLESVLENEAKKNSQGYQNIHDLHNEKILDNEAIKASEDIPREGERNDSWKETSEKIHLAGRISNQNLSRSFPDIHDPTNIKTFQNVAADTEQMSSTDQLMTEAIMTTDQPDPNNTGEFRQSSNMVDSAHPIDSAINLNKSRYDGDKRDGQDADVTGKDKITPLNAVGKEKHEEDETKQRSVETKDRLPQQDLLEFKLKRAPLSTTQEQLVVFPRNPRCGRIISLELDAMKKMKGERIGKGSFGTVYKAKMPDGDNRKFAIKLINVSSDGFQKSYEKEISNGRILHPFINPIIARAEDLSEKVVYLMYPYMENLDLRCNIDHENAGNNLRKEGEESNSQIWTRCIYQIAHAVDYLHNPVKSSYRGRVFHQDLTSRNILLDGHFNVKIGDFGMAVEANKNATSATLSKEREPHDYHPPGMNQLKYTASYDIFSVGVVMLEILTGKKTKLMGKPEYLYEKYICQGGYGDLIHDLDE